MEKIKAFFAKLGAFIAANPKPTAVFVLLTLAFLVKRYAPLEKGVLEYIDWLLLALGFGGLFTPAFQRSTSSTEDVS